MMEAIGQHDAAIDEAIESHDGVSVKPRGEGDSRFIVLASAVDAVVAAVDMQEALSRVDWATPRPIKVRALLHTGTAEWQLGDYYGSTVNRAARLRGIAHGGQTVMSSSTWELVRDGLPDGVVVEDMGEHALKDLTRPEHVYQVGPDGYDARFPPLVSLSTIPNNLPLQLTDFVGRHSELSEATRLLKGHPTAHRSSAGRCRQDEAGHPGRGGCHRGLRQRSLLHQPRRHQPARLRAIPLMSDGSGPAAPGSVLRNPRCFPGVCPDRPVWGQQRCPPFVLVGIERS